MRRSLLPSAMRGLTATTYQRSMSRSRTPSRDHLLGARSHDAVGVV
jgi:hypothetical protein